MTLDTTSPRTRRALLAGALGGVAAMAAGALGRPLAADAANGDVVHVGDDLPGTGFTRITTSGDIGFAGKSTTAASANAAGLHGLITGLGGTGVTGEATATNGFTRGVFGHSASPGGIGVHGLADAANIGCTGVQGDATDGGYGVVGTTTDGVGVRGYTNTPGGTGVAARAPLGGVALRVDGTVQFTRSGRTLMAKNTSSKKINLAGVGSASMVFAVLGSNRSGRYVRAVVSASGSFTVYLNTALGSDAWINWFVLN